MWEQIGVMYLTFPWMESDEQVLFDEQDEILNEIVKFIDEAANAGESTLVHSLHGQSRACCVLAAYFMRKFNWSLLKTLEFLNSRRADLEIRASFFCQLTQLERKLQTTGQGAMVSQWMPSPASAAPSNNTNPLFNNNQSQYPSLLSIQEQKDEELIRNTYLNSRNGAIAEMFLSEAVQRQLMLKEKKDLLTWTDLHHSKPLHVMSQLPHPSNLQTPPVVVHRRQTSLPLKSAIKGSHRKQLSAGSGDMRLTQGIQSKSGINNNNNNNNNAVGSIVNSNGMNRQFSGKSLGIAANNNTTNSHSRNSSAGAAQPNTKTNNSNINSLMNGNKSDATNGIGAMDPQQQYPSQIYSQPSILQSKITSPNNAFNTAAPSFAAVIQATNNNSNYISQQSQVLLGQQQQQLQTGQQQPQQQFQTNYQQQSYPINQMNGSYTSPQVQQSQQPLQLQSQNTTTTTIPSQQQYGQSPSSCQYLPPYSLQPQQQSQITNQQQLNSIPIKQLSSPQSNNIKPTNIKPSSSSLSNSVTNTNTNYSKLNNTNTNTNNLTNNRNSSNVGQAQPSTELKSNGKTNKSINNSNGSESTIANSVQANVINRSSSLRAIDNNINTNISSTNSQLQYPSQQQQRNNLPSSQAGFTQHPHKSNSFSLEQQTPILDNQSNILRSNSLPKKIDDERSPSAKLAQQLATSSKTNNTNTNNNTYNTSSTIIPPYEAFQPSVISFLQSPQQSRNSAEKHRPNQNNYMRNPTPPSASHVVKHPSSDSNNTKPSSSSMLLLNAGRSPNGSSSKGSNYIKHERPPLKPREQNNGMGNTSGVNGSCNTSMNSSLSKSFQAKKSLPQQQQQYSQSSQVQQQQQQQQTSYGLSSQQQQQNSLQTSSFIPQQATQYYQQSAVNKQNSLLQNNPANSNSFLNPTKNSFSNINSNTQGSSFVSSNSFTIGNNNNNTNPTCNSSFMSQINTSSFGNTSFTAPQQQQQQQQPLGTVNQTFNNNQTKNAATLISSSTNSNNTNSKLATNSAKPPSAKPSQTKTNGKEQQQNSTNGLHTYLMYQPMQNNFLSKETVPISKQYQQSQTQKNTPAYRSFSPDLSSLQSKLDKQKQLTATAAASKNRIRSNSPASALNYSSGAGGILSSQTTTSGFQSFKKAQR